ncbi:MAG: 30S ribosomal protein S16 [Anaerolineae bacterium]|nr:30S ribosomal protein S16 [Candidatus Roseilinea sp.]MDW8450254.1 30S ribosomal protein S16 [Anaerolineae bacterium]
MVRIRLRRMGSKKQPTYRIVVCDKEAPRDGAFIEVIGIYNPRTEPETVRVQEDRALYWMKVGAQPSEAVQQLFRKTGTTARFERLKQGESPEALLAEAAAQAAAAPAIIPKTRIGRKPVPKPKKAEPAPEAAAE